MKTVTGDYIQKYLSDDFAKAAFARIEEMGRPLWSVEHASDRKDGCVMAFPNIWEYSVPKEMAQTIKAAPAADFNAAVINAYRVLEDIGAQPFKALLANPEVSELPACIDAVAPPGPAPRALYVTDRLVGGIVRTVV